jgi:hypothetical protein
MRGSEFCANARHSVHLTDDEFEGYMEKALAPVKHAAVEEHLAICPRCMADVQIVRDALVLQ